jgi:tetraacyldisaccharide 4'-kinase
MKGKMNMTRPLLIPFSFFYGLVIFIRNWLFDTGLLPSSSFSLPVISVGNITVGGTGKTPHVEYLAQLLKNNYSVAVLSRGYKRRTNGFLLASLRSKVHEIGDEPLQIKLKVPDVHVAVNRNRVEGIRKLSDLFPSLDLVILDDAFQHRYIKPGLSILLVDYNRPIYADFLLPAGNLRESWRNSKRADIIIVTKCPPRLGPYERKRFIKKLKVRQGQKVYFTTYTYGTPVQVFPWKHQNKEIMSYKALRKNKVGVLLVTGIANPDPLISFLRNEIHVDDSITYHDHHFYTQRDLAQITNRFNNLGIAEKIILTTEKDAVRLRELEISGKKLRKALYYIPVEVKFLAKGEKPFIKRIYQYMKKTGR